MVLKVRSTPSFRVQTTDYTSWFVTLCSLYGQKRREKRLYVMVHLTTEHVSSREDGTCLIFFHWSYREFWAISCILEVSADIKTPICTQVGQTSQIKSTIQIFQNHVSSVSEKNQKEINQQHWECQCHDFAHLSPRYLVMD